MEVYSKISNVKDFRLRYKENPIKKSAKKKTYCKKNSTTSQKMSEAYVFKCDDA